MTDAIIGVVMDRSGSMDSMWGEAVEGFNRFKNEQATEDGTAWITLNYFNEKHGQKYYAWDAKDIPDLAKNDDEIFPRGMTALVDSTIRTIRDVDGWLLANDWFDGKVFVVVITDGLENASKSRPSELKGLIGEKEAAGWEFIYLAANVDTEATARNYGFRIQNSMTYDDNSVAASYSTLSNAVARSRSTGDRFGLKDSERDVTGV